MDFGLFLRFEADGFEFGRGERDLLAEESQEEQRRDGFYGKSMALYGQKLLLLPMKSRYTKSVLYEVVKGYTSGDLNTRKAGYNSLLNFINP